MNNPKYDYFPFLRLLYYIRSLIGAVTALTGIPSLISGEQEIYKYILSLVATLLFFLIARFFTEKDCRAKIPVLFFFFCRKRIHRDNTDRPSENRNTFAVSHYPFLAYICILLNSSSAVPFQVQNVCFELSGLHCIFLLVSISIYFLLGCIEECFHVW